MNIMLKFSQLNGLISDIFSGIGNFFTNIISLLLGKIMVEVYHIIAIPIFTIIDGIQLLFRKFAGLDTYKINGTTQSGDIVLTLINNPTVQNVFWSLLILAVVLLIITTIVAIIKSQTQASGDKDKKTINQIFVSSLKALVNFFMVPVVAILGIFMGNALLKSLDQATSGGESTRMSSMVFTTCAYEANRARTSTTFAEDLAINHLNDMGVLKGTTENIADVIDQAFKNSTTFEAKSFDFSKNTANFFSSDMGDYFYLSTMTIWSGGTAYIPRTSFSVYDMWQVFYYYDLVSFNYLFFIIAGLFVGWVLLSTSIGLIKRMFKLTILLVVSPPIAALMPIDNGTALSKWRKQFIGSTLSAYATIVALNLTMMLLGPISQIDFFYYSDSYTGIIPTAFNQVAQLLILCGALYFFKDITKGLSDIIGAENAYEDGAKATGDLSAKLAKGALAATGIVGGIKAMGTASKLKQASLNKEMGLESANKNLEDAQKEFDAVRNQGNNSKAKISAKNRLEDAKKAQAKAQEDYNKSQESVGAYQFLAHQRLGAARARFTSLATNGISDKIAKEAGDMDKQFGLKKANAEAKKLSGGLNKGVVSKVAGKAGAGVKAVWNPVKNFMVSPKTLGMQLYANKQTKLRKKAIQAQIDGRDLGAEIADKKGSTDSIKQNIKTNNETVSTLKSQLKVKKPEVKTTRDPAVIDNVNNLNSSLKTAQKEISQSKKELSSAKKEIKQLKKLKATQDKELKKYNKDKK